MTTGNIDHDRYSPPSLISSMVFAAAVLAVDLVPLNVLFENVASISEL